jgi:hypothetical protein
MFKIKKYQMLFTKVGACKSVLRVCTQRIGVGTPVPVV